ncbi:RluA family pseudouridine synthase [Treponema sp.]|uniref:RluA family pseudouridine synthase n=1 Tax=Treponema sp. TaxID=166 RepID=UPI0025E5BC1B|nr:RluA family pseudouridine synthase [Treponema sp.]MCR5219308.1 RluA family pseudouridine synthase [Treponema sp.]
MKDFPIIFENDEILVINKPCGTPVQGGKGIAHPLDEELSARLGYRIHLVHRLDKETSGLLIVAKNPAAASKWTTLIGTKEVKKEYMCVCCGEVICNGKPSRKGKLVSKVEAHGRVQDAELFFDVVKSVEAEIPETESRVKLNLVHIVLGTGRMHQIRIQMAKNGAPLAADDQHGNFKLNKLLRKLGIKKLQLACVRLTIPVNGKEKVLQVDLPEHFYKFSD